jgi:hypothetical protein
MHARERVVVPLRESPEIVLVGKRRSHPSESLLDIIVSLDLLCPVLACGIRHPVKLIDGTQCLPAEVITSAVLIASCAAAVTASVRRRGTTAGFIAARAGQLAEVVVSSLELIEGSLVVRELGLIPIPGADNLGEVPPVGGLSFLLGEPLVKLRSSVVKLITGHAHFCLRSALVCAPLGSAFLAKLVGRMTSDRWRIGAIVAVFQGAHVEPFGRT